MLLLPSVLLLQLEHFANWPEAPRDPTQFGHAPGATTARNGCGKNPDFPPGFEAISINYNSDQS